MAESCWACRSHIEDGQILCNECKNWQGWRKYFNISTLTLSLLIALLSVLGTVGPTIKQMLFPGSPNLTVAGSYTTGLVKKGDGYFGDDLLSLSVTNIGKQPGALRPALNCASIEVSDRTLAFDSISPTLVEAGKSSVVSYKQRFVDFDGSIDRDGNPTQSKTGMYKCEVNLGPPSLVVVINHSGEVHAAPLNFAVISVNAIGPDCAIGMLSAASLEKCTK